MSFSLLGGSARGVSQLCFTCHPLKCSSNGEARPVFRFEEKLGHPIWDIPQMSWWSGEGLKERAGLGLYIPPPCSKPGLCPLGHFHPTGQEDMAKSPLPQSPTLEALLLVESVHPPGTGALVPSPGIGTLSGLSVEDSGGDTEEHSDETGRFLTQVNVCRARTLTSSSVKWA